MIRLIRPTLSGLALAGILCLPQLSIAPLSAAENTFGAYAGSFSGRGTLKRQPDAPAETVRCRITSKLSPDGNSLVQAGTCVVPGSKVAIDSRLTYDPGTRRIRGTWTDVANGTAAGVSGTASGSRVELTITGKDRKTGENRTLWMTLEPRNNGYMLTTRSPDPAGGARFVSGEIRFTK